MKLLAELHDADVGLPFVATTTYTLRKTVRGVIRDTDGNIALEFSEKYNFYVIPGGGIEEGEPIVDTLHREIKEEVGYTINEPTPVGLVIEYGNALGKLQISYGFTATIRGDLTERKLTPDEIEAGCQIQWMPLHNAITLLDAQHTHVMASPMPDDKKKFERAYFERFATKRDLVLLWEARHVLKF